MFKTKPALQVFMQVCAAHRAETQEALEQVLRAMILRRDAEKVLRQAGEAEIDRRAS